MSIDLPKLAGQGRAFSGSRCWADEELEALLRLERERGLGRLAAADYIRNGILTLEAYDSAVKANFQPKTLDDAKIAAEASLKDNKFAAEVEAPKPESTPEGEAPKSEPEKKVEHKGKHK